MDALLQEVVPPEDLKKYELIYNNEKKQGKASAESQFNYALCLVRSKYPTDIQSGIKLLEDLFHDNPEGRRDYIYFMALGHARLQNYTKSLNLLRSFEEVEPNNVQIEGLKKYVKGKLQEASRKGIIAAGGGLVALGVTVLAGVLLARK